MPKLDITGFKDKDSAKPEYRELYERLPFIEAYAAHTDMRIEKDGPELAIGAKKDGMQDWDIHGRMQLDFLISQGLTPESTLLDIGCGTGRLACKAVPYLNHSKYAGIDISAAAIQECRTRVPNKGKMPTFMWSADGGLSEFYGSDFDLVFAHSVFTHLPHEIINRILGDLTRIDFGKFFFTYKESEKPSQRSGLKQFQYSVEYFKEMASTRAMSVDRIPFDWPAGQKTIRVTRV